MATAKGTNTKAKTSVTVGTKAAAGKAAVDERSTKEVTAKRAAIEKSGTSKQTNSGGTLRTASQQAEPTQSREAKEASSNVSGSKTIAKTKSSSAKASTSTKSGASANKNTQTAEAKSRKKPTAKSDGLISTVIDKVSGLFTTGELDAVDLLKADHRTVEDLFEKVKANEDGNNKPFFKKIKAELDTHTHIEETIFYPYLLDKGKKDLKDITREGIEEHHQAKMFLSEMDGMTGSSEKFKAKLKVLMEDIEHHVKEEENEMFKLVRNQFSSKKLQELGGRMQAEKESFNKKPVKATKPAKSSVSAKRATAA